MTTKELKQLSEKHHLYKYYVEGYGI